MRPKENNPLEFPKGIDGWEKPGGSETPGPETVRDRWFWAEPAVWTERMLTALEPARTDSVRGTTGGIEANHRIMSCRLYRPRRSGRRQTYRPQTIRRVHIPKPGTNETRPLGIPTVRDRIVQAAVVNVIEPISERDFAEHSYGFRRRRRVARPKFGRVPKAQEAPPSAILSYLTVKSSFNSIPGGHLIDVPTDFLSSYQRAELHGQSTHRSTNPARTGFWCLYANFSSNLRRLQRLKPQYRACQIGSVSGTCCQ